MQRFFCILILTAISLALVVPVEAAMPDVSAQAAALVDIESGEILTGVNMDDKVYPASTAKILTAMIALERAELTDMVTISERAQNQEGTSLYSRTGEQYKLEDLLYVLLVHSANDAAVAIAEHVAGSVEEFAPLMNEKATELGATNSHFCNPNGLHDPEHYTTAADMAKIFAAAMHIPLLQEITTTRVYQITIGSGERRILINGNRMLTEYAGTIGGKTGYTRQAGNCLLTAAQRGDLKLGVVIFKGQGKAVWNDAKTVLNYGFSHWCRKPIVVQNQSVSALPVKYGNTALLVAGDSLGMTVSKQQMELPVRHSISLSRSLRAPLQAGQVVGEATYCLGDMEVGKVELRVAHSVPRHWYTYWEVLLCLGCVIFAWRWRQQRWTK